MTETVAPLSKCVVANKFVANSTYYLLLTCGSLFVFGSSLWAVDAEVSLKDYEVSWLSAMLGCMYEACLKEGKMMLYLMSRMNTCIDV